MDGYVTIGTKLDTKSFDAQIDYVKSQLQEIEDLLKRADAGEEIGKDTMKLEAQYEILTEKLRKLVKKKEELNKAPVTDFSAIKRSIDSIEKSVGRIGKKIFSLNLSKRFDNIGKSIQGVTRRVVRWGLALFGIRAMYGFIRQAVNSVSQSNEGIANQIDFMKNVLGTALEPIIKRIISLIYTLLSFINSIVKQLTGKDIFAQAKKNMQSGAKSAKEIRKQLAGFDEMNILGDNTSASGGGGFNTDDFIKENTKLLKMLEKFKKMVMKGDWAKIGKTVSKAIINGLNGLADKIKSIDWSGIGRKISDFLTNLDFSGILVGLVTVFGEALLGFQEMWLNIDWPKIFANLSNGLANAIFEIDKYIKQIKWKEIANMVSKTFTSIKWGKLGSSILQTIWDAMKGLLTLIVNLDWGKIGKTISDSLKQWIQTILKNFKETNWEEAGEKIANDISDFIENFDWIGVGEGIIETIIAGITGYKEFAKGLIVGFIDRLLKDLGLDEKARKKGKEIAEKVVSGLIEYFMFTAFPLITIAIKTIFTDEGKKAVNNFVEGLKDLVPKVIKKFEQLVKEINKTLNKINPINIGVNAGKSLGSKVKNLFGFAKGGVVVPKLASGGIINQPGRGVPIGSAIGGERGMEGVIPLTDSQQMQLLGEAIGRYITVDLTNITELDGRQIARKVEQIRQNNSFVLNR